MINFNMYPRLFRSSLYFFHYYFLFFVKVSNLSNANRILLEYLGI